MHSHIEQKGPFTFGTYPRHNNNFKKNPRHSEDSHSPYSTRRVLSAIITPARTFFGYYQYRTITYNRGCFYLLLTTRRGKSNLFIIFTSFYN